MRATNLETYAKRQALGRGNKSGGGNKQASCRLAATFWPRDRSICAGKEGARARALAGALYAPARPNNSTERERERERRGEREQGSSIKRREANVNDLGALPILSRASGPLLVNARRCWRASAPDYWAPIIVVGGRRIIIMPVAVRSEHPKRNLCTSSPAAWCPF